MAYRSGNRNQMYLFPECMNNSIAENDPVRAYDEFIESIDLQKLGIEVNPDKVGNSSYNPKAMVKLIVYGPAYGWRSSRKLERAVHHNVSFMWLMEGLKPDHKTIAEFRRRNVKALKKILKICCKLCCALGLIEGNVLFTDGTKIRANAGRANMHTHEWYKKNEQEVEQRIEKLLNECENIDRDEVDQGSLVKMNKELADNKRLKEKIKHALKTFDERGKKTSVGKDRKVNLTDPESALMSGVQGSHTSYNVQSVVDDKHGLITHIEAVEDPVDSNQFDTQIKQAEETIGTECEVSCADAGYANVNRQDTIAQRGTTVIVPSQRQAMHGKEKPFSKSKFRYDNENNCYYCPEGKKLRYLRANKKAQYFEYLISNPDECLSCLHYGICTKAKNGRRVTRLFKEDLKEHFEAVYEQEENQAIYKRRKEQVEHPFGHIKHNLGFTHFLLRGKNNVQAEISIAATCFNIARMITIYGGVQHLIRQLSLLRG